MLSPLSLLCSIVHLPLLMSFMNVRSNHRDIFHVFAAKSKRAQLDTDVIAIQIDVYLVHLRVCIHLSAQHTTTIWSIHTLATPRYHHKQVRSISTQHAAEYEKFDILFQVLLSATSVLLSRHSATSYQLPQVEARPIVRHYPAKNQSPDRKSWRSPAEQASTFARSRTRFRITIG